MRIVCIYVTEPSCPRYDETLLAYEFPHEGFILENIHDSKTAMWRYGEVDIIETYEIARAS